MAKGRFGRREAVAEEGVLLHAYGERYVRQACLATASIRQVDKNLPVALVSDYYEPNMPVDIHISIRPDDVEEFTKYRRLVSIKAKFLMCTPFRKTVFLDADTYTRKSFRELFVLLDAYDFLIAYAPKLVQSPRPSGERTLTQAIDRLTCVGAYNSGVLGYAMNDRVEQLLGLFWETFLRNSEANPDSGTWGPAGVNDQNTLQRLIASGAMGRLGVKMHVIPNVIYNATGAMWPLMKALGLWDAAKIIHSNAIFNYIKRTGVDGLPDLDYLQDFSLEKLAARLKAA